MISPLLAAVMWIAAAPSNAAEFTVLPASPMNAAGTAPKEMMHAYLMRLAVEASERRTAEYEKLKTPEQLAAYQERMRQFFIDQLGGLPERTPLEPQVVGTIRRDGYRVEKVIYQSRPRHYVTAALFLPEAKPPYPGVLVPCGHSDNGKAIDTYQRACILLARNGMAALCYDPIDQGERFQLLDEKGVPRVRGTMAHCLAGVGSILVGRNTASYRVWDGIRSLDYLASRPEIDPRRLGCTGNSGGGTLTSFLMALDPRIQCAAPSCYLTTLRRLLETIGPQDAEQHIHAQLAYGMDHADFILMRAPRPTLMCVATRDYFDITGAWDTFRQAKRFYTRLGYAERMSLIETDASHGFSTQLRVGAVRWMRRWLLAKDDAITEPMPEAKSDVLSDKELQCTPQGQVMQLAGARSVYDFNVELEQQLAAGRKKLWEQAPQAALEQVRRIAGIRKLAELPEPKCERIDQNAAGAGRMHKLILEPEPGIRLPALAFLPEKPTGEATLYLHAAGKQADAGPGGPIEKLVGQGQLVLAVDLRGVGETQGGKNSSYAKFLGPEWPDVFLAYMLDKSHVGMRAEDILVCARFLARYQAAGPRKLHLVSIGATGPAALHAAAMEPGLFATVTLQGALASWAEVVRTPMAHDQFVNVVHGALRVYDLPDLAASLPKGILRIVAPRGAMDQPEVGGAR